MTSLPTGPTGPAAPTGISAQRLTSVVVGVGVALLSAAIVLSTTFSRADGALDWSNFAVGLLATVALLALAGLGVLAFPDVEARVALASWPVAFGALGAGLMAVVAMDSSSASPWIAGLLVTAIGAGGFALVRRPAPALAAVVGLVVLYAKALDGLLGDPGDNALMTAGLVVVAFVLLITAAAWFLPGTRDVVAVTVGAAGALALLGIIAASSVVAVVAGLGPAAFGDDSGASFDPLDGLRDDLYVLLVLGAVLVLVWALLGLVTGHPGYRVLVVGLVATQLPLTISVLSVEHPSVLGAVILAAGGLALLVALLRARSAGGPSAPAAYGAPTSAPPSGPPTYGPPSGPPPYGVPTGPPSGPPSGPPTGPPAMPPPYRP